MFKKLSPSPDWSEACKDAWSVITNANLVKAEGGLHCIGRSWLNARIRKWTKECDKETRKQNLKDSDGNLRPILLPSNSPLGEFGETSSRCKTATFDPTIPAGNTADPGTHLVMAVFGVLTYELNKCDAATSEVNVTNCHRQLEVCRSYASLKDDFSPMLAGMPTKLIEDMAATTAKKKKDKEDSAVDYGKIQQEVAAVGTVEKLCTQVIKVIAAAKLSEGGSPQAPEATLLANVFEEFKWEKISTGTVYKYK